MRVRVGSGIGEGRGVGESSWVGGGGGGGRGGWGGGVVVPGLAQVSKAARREPSASPLLPSSSSRFARVGPSRRRAAAYMSYGTTSCAPAYSLKDIIAMCCITHIPGLCCFLCSASHGVKCVSLDDPHTDCMKQQVLDMYTPTQRQVHSGPQVEVPAGHVHEQTVIDTRLSCACVSCNGDGRYPMLLQEEPTACISSGGALMQAYLRQAPGLLACA